MRLPRQSRDPDVVRGGEIASGIDVNRVFRWLTSYAGLEYRAATGARCLVVVLVFHFVYGLIVHDGLGTDRGMTGTYVSVPTQVTSAGLDLFAPTLRFNSR
jgi:hypothetical protein